MTKTLLFVILGLIFLTLSSCQQTSQVFSPDSSSPVFIQPDIINKNIPTPLSSSSATLSEFKHVQISTTKGDFVVELFPENAPLTVANFVTKSNSGFYHQLTFHRVEDWVVQGGDPSGDGTGGGQIFTELNQLPFLSGSLGAARGDNITFSNDSQFFICTQDCSWLTGKYTNFGAVIEGYEVVKQLVVGDQIISTRIF